MNERLNTEIKRKSGPSEIPRFVQRGVGYYGQIQREDSGVTFKIERQNRDKHENVRKQLLAKMGFDDAGLTKRSKDGGVDIRGTLVVGDVVSSKWRRRSRDGRIRFNR